jgi:hypothetical protein
MKLISMTDFVLECCQNSKLEEYNQVNETFVNKVIAYANFLKQPLKLEMFVPCDEDGNVLTQCEEICSCECDKIKNYRKAKEKVLFEGFELKDKGGWFTLMFEGNYYKSFANFNDTFKNKKIENFIAFDLELTPNAIKQIGL